MELNEIYDGLNKAYFSENCHEREVILHLPRLIKKSKIFVDIGASLGQYTKLANECMRGGIIYAIEPDPIRFKELERNCKKWERTSNNELIPLENVVSDRNGEISFFTTNSGVSGGLFQRRISDKKVEWSRVRCESVTLDALFEVDTPDFVKIDVEGSELRVLEGSNRILRKGKTKFLIEIHSWSDPDGQNNADEIVGLMKSFGYEIVNYHGRSLFVKAKAVCGIRLKTFLQRLVNYAKRKMANFILTAKFALSI